MVNDQKIAGNAGRDTLPVEVLAEILFKDSIGQLEQKRIACNFYPTMSTTGEKRLIKNFNNFSNWVVALVHPNPQYHPSIVDIVNTPIKTEDFYFWLYKKPFSLSPEAKLFMKAFEEKNIRVKEIEKSGNLKNKTSKEIPSIKNGFAIKLEKQKRNKKWIKAYQNLKKKRRNMSKTWYSKQIAEMEIANGKSWETIRDVLKKL